MYNITILGSGSWGIALALTLNDNNHNVTLWTKFKEEAERRGLIIERDPIYGWTISKPGQRLLDWLQTVQLSDIQLHRTIPQYAVAGSSGTVSGGSKGTSTAGSKRERRYKEYICPCCKATVRSNATQELHLRCEDCQELFELVAP